MKAIRISFFGNLLFASSIGEWKLFLPRNTELITWMVMILLLHCKGV